LCQHWQKINRAERQQEREAEERSSKSSLLSRSTTSRTYSKQKAYSAGKEKQARSQHQREARYDVFSSVFSTHKLKLSLYLAELLNYLSLLLCEIESI